MSFLSSADLAQMRADVAYMLPGTCIIKLVGTAQITVDSAGGWTETPAAATAGTVACRVDPVKTSSSQLMTTQQLQELVGIQYRLTVPYNAPLAPNCQVEYLSRTYQVVELEIDHSWNVSRRAIMVEMR